MPTDSERLDWLERTGAMLYRCYDPELDRWVVRTSTPTAPADTARAAIDLAMEAEARQAERGPSDS